MRTAYFPFFTSTRIARSSCPPTFASVCGGKGFDQTALSAGILPVTRLRWLYILTHLDGNEAIVDDESVSLDWQCRALAEGLACYRREEFFEAHEHWESAWLRLKEPEKSFLQALIQLTAAFHHLQTGNRAGAVSLLRRVRRKLELCPAHFAGIAVTPLLREVGDWLRALEGDDAPMPPAYPRICPLGRPPASEPGC